MNTTSKCTCPDVYGIYPHGNDDALYFARCEHRKGYQLAVLVDTSYNFDTQHITRLLNLGAEVYWSAPDKGYLAE